METAHRMWGALGGRLGIARTLLRSQRRVLGWNRSQHTPMPVGDRLPVIFCTWRRLDRLERTLHQLAAQNVPVQALIWNNSPDCGRVDAAARSADLPVTVHHSPRNIGGFGRFYLAREAAEQGHATVVFIDDDQDFGPGTMKDLLSAHRPRSLSGWWALSFRSAAYGSRFRGGPGDPAGVVGTGGMIADTAVFRDTRLFHCPRRYWFLEDIWLSYVAGHLCAYDLFQSPAQFQFESADDEHALYLAVGQTKAKFVRYLIGLGWNLVLADEARTTAPASADTGIIAQPWPTRSVSYQDQP